MVEDKDRLVAGDLDCTVGEIVERLSDGNPIARFVLNLALAKQPLFFLTADLRRLYGEDIYDVFRYVCGEDIDRFVYHVCSELPNQATGAYSATGGWVPFDGEARDAWWAARTHGAENVAAGGMRRFWALADPPLDDPNYEYPINAGAKE